MNRQVAAYLASLLLFQAADPLAPSSQLHNSGKTAATAPYTDLRVIHADVPTYPQLARSARISGAVEVFVKVVKGRVKSVKATSGHPVLVASTLQNVRTWCFHPLVTATFTTTFTYELSSSADLDPQNPRVELALPLSVKIRAVPVILD
jgi:TonB family protein